MAWLSRRRFVQIAGLLGSALVVPRALWARLRPASVDPVRLGSVADAVLPSHLGDGGKAGIAEGFLAWLDGYRPGAERSHGYGSDSMEVRHLPPDPSSRWEAQLDRLDALAREHSAAGFAELPREERQRLLRGELAEEAAPGMRSPEDSVHVATGLMAFYFGSAEAWNHAYGARIDKWRCRSLEGVGDKPAALGGGG